MVTQSLLTMARYAFLLMLISLWQPSPAQDARVLADAERSFEKTCLQIGLRDGFIQYADSLAIMFGEQGPMNARAFWRSLPFVEGVFSWSPAFAEISAGGDWGYTTGNFEHRPRTLADTPNSYGQYTTVWHRNKLGEWKFLIDVGNPHDPLPLDKEARIIRVKKAGGQNLKTDSTLPDAEWKFIEAMKAGPKQAYEQYAGSNYIFNFTGRPLLFSTDSALGLLPAGLHFRPAGARQSPRGDMAAVYGLLENGSRQGIYVRIWRQEPGGWKIAMEVIRL